MKTYFVDTNFFLRYLLLDVPSQVKIVEKYLQEAKKGKINIYVCQITIFEIMYILEKTVKLGKKPAIKLTRTITSLPYVEIEDRQLFLESFDLYENKNVDFVDAFLFCKAANNGAQVLSFDKDFKKLDN
ncbi:MAG: PIN domain-containing protein [Patescibacteria group bacterium]|nr:PIN domain-containing protein [Patescibacteria group bacterium]